MNAKGFVKREMARLEAEHSDAQEDPHTRRARAAMLFVTKMEKGDYDDQFDRMSADESPAARRRLDFERLKAAQSPLDG